MTDTLDSRRSWVVLVLLFTLPFLCSLPWPIMATLLDTEVPPPFLAPFGILHFFLSWIVFGNPVLYVLVCGGLIGISSWALLRERPRWWQRILLVGIIVLTLLYMTWPYEPAVEAAPGYSLTLVTKPPLFANGLARAQAIGEHIPCTYTILGWQATTLFYRADCGLWGDALWAIDPTTMRTPRHYHAVPPTNLTQALSLAETWEQIESFAAYPPDVDLRRIHVKDPGYHSPDGRWTALASQYIYARADVILIAPAE